MGSYFQSQNGGTSDHSVFLPKPEAHMLLHADVIRGRVLTAVLGKRGDIGDGWEEIYSYQCGSQVNLVFFLHAI